jgi:hypothetical protein
VFKNNRNNLSIRILSDRLLKVKQDVLGRTNRQLSFDTTQMSQKMEKTRGIHRHTDSRVISKASYFRIRKVV